MIVMHRNAFAMHVNRHLSQRYSNYSRKTQTIVEERPVEEATNPTSGVMVSKKPNPALANMFTTTNRQTYQNKSNTVISKHLHHILTSKYFNYFKPVPQVMFLVDEQERRVRHVARSWSYKTYKIWQKILFLIVSLGCSWVYIFMKYRDPFLPNKLAKALEENADAKFILGDNIKVVGEIGQFQWIGGSGIFLTKVQSENGEALVEMLGKKEKDAYGQYQWKMTRTTIYKDKYKFKIYNESGPKYEKMVKEAQEKFERIQREGTGADSGELFSIN